MVNPFLNDPIERITRDPVRKLGWEDRLIGSIRLTLDAGVQPLLLAEGTKVALERASRETDTNPRQLLTKIWSREAGEEETNEVLNLLTD